MDTSLGLLVSVIVAGLILTAVGLVKAWNADE